MRCDLRPIYFLWASVPRLSFSVPPNGGSVVSTVTRKAWVRADWGVHANQGLFRTLTQREGANRITWSIPPQLGIVVDGPRLLRQLPWVLFRTKRTCCYCISQLTVFQGQSSILGNISSHPGTTLVATLPVHPICCVYPRVSFGGSYLSWGISLLIARVCPCL